jgi:hypothetical protein
MSQDEDHEATARWIRTNIGPVSAEHFERDHGLPPQGEDHEAAELLRECKRSVGYAMRVKIDAYLSRAFTPERDTVRLRSAVALVRRDVAYAESVDRLALLHRLDVILAEFPDTTEADES